MLDNTAEYREFDVECLTLSSEYEMTIECLIHTAEYREFDVECLILSVENEVLDTIECLIHTV